MSHCIEPPLRANRLTQRREIQQVGLFIAGVTIESLNGAKKSRNERTEHRFLKRVFFCFILKIFLERMILFMILRQILTIVEMFQMFKDGHHVFVQIISV